MQRDEIDGESTHLLIVAAIAAVGIVLVSGLALATVRIVGWLAGAV